MKAVKCNRRSIAAEFCRFKTPGEHDDNKDDAERPVTYLGIRLTKEAAIDDLVSRYKEDMWHQADPFDDRSAWNSTPKRGWSCIPPRTDMPLPPPPMPKG